MSSTTLTLETPRGAGRVAGAARDSVAVAIRNLIAYRRVPQLLVFSTIQPVIFVLMFRYVFGGAIRLPGNTPYVDYLMPGIFVQTVVFGSLAAAIGLHFVPQRNEIRFNRPILPAFLDEVELHGLKVGKCEADILLRRHAIDVGVTVLRRSGPVNVVTIS